MMMGAYDADGNLITDAETDATNPWAGALTSIASAYQIKLLVDTNAERAARGLPPVNMSAIAPQVNVGIPPEQMKMILLGVAAIVAAIYFSKR